MYQVSAQSSANPSMSIYGIQGQILEVTVVGCNKLKDTEWISRQDPYVCVEYGSTKFRTRTCTALERSSETHLDLMCVDGGKNPTFQEKFVFTLIEGLRELKIVVWNSNTLSFDDFIGSGKVQLQKVLSQGYDDSPWPLQTKTTGRYAGEVRLIMHYANANKPATNFAPSAPPYATPPIPQVPLYSAPPPASAAPYPPPPTSYPAPSPYPSYPHSSAAYPPNSAAYPPTSAAYPPTSAAYPPTSAAYPPPPYPPPHPAAYPPQPYPPPSVYPPPPYPPPPQASPYHHQGPYPGMYPPPPY